MSQTASLNAPIETALDCGLFFDLMRTTGASFSVNICEAQLAVDADAAIPTTIGYEMGSISRDCGEKLLAELSKDLFLGIDAVTVSFGHIVSSVLTPDGEIQDREIHIFQTHPDFRSDVAFHPILEVDLDCMMRIGRQVDPTDLEALAPAEVYAHNPETGAIKPLEHVKRISAAADIDAIADIVELQDLGPDEQVHIDFYEAEGLSAVALSLVDTSPELAEPTRAVLHAALQ